MTKEEFREEMDAFLKEFGIDTTVDLAEEVKEVRARISEFGEHDATLGLMLNQLVDQFLAIETHVKTKLKG